MLVSPSKSAHSFIDSTIQKLSQNISVVLICTSHSGNIGSVARAMKNMGLKKLALVAPKDFPSEQAYSLASGADDVLDEALVVDTLDDAIANSHIVVGASARTRKMSIPLVDPKELAEYICTKSLSSSDHNDNSPEIAILFGREASGLTNEELHRCNYHVHIPANPDYSSLNLAMAVQVISYELRQAALGLGDSPKRNSSIFEQASVTSPSIRQDGEELAEVNEIEGFLGHLESTLIKIGYHDPDNPRMLMTRLRRLFQRAQMDKAEVNIMRGILKDVMKAAQRR